MLERLDFGTKNGPQVVQHLGPVTREGNSPMSMVSVPAGDEPCNFDDLAAEILRAASTAALMAQPEFRAALEKLSDEHKTALAARHIDHLRSIRVMVTEMINDAEDDGGGLVAEALLAVDDELMHAEIFAKEAVEMTDHMPLAMAYAHAAHLRNSRTSNTKGPSIAPSGS